MEGAASLGFNFWDLGGREDLRARLVAVIMRAAGFSVGKRHDCLLNEQLVRERR